MLTKKNKVISVYPKKKKKDVFIVKFIDGSIYELSKGIIISESIYKGSVISDPDFEKILQKHAYDRAQGAGLTLLSYRMRSKKELFNKLIKKNIDTTIVSRVVAKFEIEGWINDFEFGIAFSKDQINQNSIGPIALKYKLKGYIDADDLIKNVIEKIYKDFSIDEIILNVLKRFNPEKINSDDSLRQKLINKLKRKGHYWQDIDDSINKYIE